MIPAQDDIPPARRALVVTLLAQGVSPETIALCTESSIEEVARIVVETGRAEIGRAEAGR